MFKPAPIVGFGLVQFKTALEEVKVPAPRVVGSKHLETTKTSSKNKSSPWKGDVCVISDTNAIYT